MSPKPSLLRVKFNDFANLPSKPGKRVYSEPLTDTRGNAWKVVLKPGGDSYCGRGRGDREDPHVGVCLKNEGQQSVVVSASFILRDALGKVYSEICCKSVSFEAGGMPRGRRCYIKRSAILDAGNNILADGALHVDVQLRFKPEEESLHVPPSSIRKKMLELLEDEEGGDVSFKVEEEVIAAHALILRMNSSVLFNSCEENNDGSHVQISGATPEVFRIVLRYVYGEEVPDARIIKDSSREIIDAANRFGVVGLKLTAEAVLVESLVIDADNAADWLVFADAKTCPLLKEHAMSLCVLRATDILSSDSSQKLNESPSLLKELVQEVSKSSNNDDRFDNGSNVSVNDLRKQLHARGLDVDGSREMLVSRLLESNKRQRTE